MSDPNPNNSGSIDNVENDTRILLIDDEPHIVTALRRELEQESFSITTFTDPHQAQENLNNQEFALIISDNLMPGLTGLELLSRVKEQAPLTRRILLTGHTDLNQAVQAFNEGTIHRFINKPWDKSELLGVLREELSLYRSQKQEQISRGQLEDASRKRTAQLQKTVVDLKQAQTQVALYEDAAQIRKISLSPILRRLSFLVVEENKSVRDLIVKSIQKVGISFCYGVAGPHEALKFLKSSRSVDVILSEWGMSEMDGIALFRVVKEENFLSPNGVFIFITTQENRKAVEFALKEGVDYYLIKPFRLNTLFEHLEKLFRKGQREFSENKIQALRGLSFLVANVDQDSRYRFQQMLLTRGIQNVTIADTGTKALRVVGEKKVDVLILDFNLRDLYWENLKDKLEQLDAPFSTPALVVTSVSPMHTEFEEIRDAGLSVFIPGEITQSEFFEAIFKALEEVGG